MSGRRANARWVRMTGVEVQRCQENGKLSKVCTVLGNFSEVVEMEVRVE